MYESAEPTVLMPHVQVGRESPAELKAAKLARGRARSLEDRGLKPNTAEREAIEAIIKAPPNRCTPGCPQHGCHAVLSCCMCAFASHATWKLPVLHVSQAVYTRSCQQTYVQSQRCTATFLSS